MSNGVYLLHGPSPVPHEPYRWLATAIIALARIDAVNERLPVEARRQARAFFDGHTFEFWCSVAGLDVAMVRELAGRYESPMRRRGPLISRSA